MAEPTSQKCLLAHGPLMHTDSWREDPASHDANELQALRIATSHTLHDTVQLHCRLSWYQSLRGGGCRVQGRALMPGTAFFELASAAAASLADAAVHICGVSILTPKTLQPGEPGLSLSCSISCANGMLKIHSPGSPSPHLTAHVGCARASHTTSTAPQWTLLRSLVKHSSQSCATARLAALSRPSDVGSEAFRAHPAPADSALHLGAIFERQGDTPRVPVGLTCLVTGDSTLLGHDTSNGWALAGEQACPYLF